VTTTPVPSQGERDLESHYLRALSADAARHHIAAFDDRYKRDWEHWTDVSGSHPIPSELCVRELRKTLQKWQSVRARVKDRVIRITGDGTSEARPPASLGHSLQSLDVGDSFLNEIVQAHPIGLAERMSRSWYTCH